MNQIRRPWIRKDTQNLKFRYHQITGYVYALLHEYDLALSSFNQAHANANLFIDEVKSLIYIGYCDG